MSQKTFSLVAGLIFLVMTALHILRLAIGWHVVFAGWTIPMWVSWIAVPIAGFLAFEGLRLSRRP
jgi:hypothetical protein